jgi:CheY-like chemotaxis protein
MEPMETTENTDSKKTILVIDDLTITLTAIRSMLEGTYGVSVAKSAIDGWVVLKSIPVNLILLDIEMPGISGMEFMANLQKSPYRDIPVIFVTSNRSFEVINKARDLGARGYIAKPISAKVLLAKIGEVLRGPSAEQPSGN